MPDHQPLPTIGIIGAGKLGITLAQLALKAGYPVNIAGSGLVTKIALTIKILTPGAQAMTSADAAQNSDIIILAIPLSSYKKLPVAQLAGKLVIDATNYWWEVDGPKDALLPPTQSTSQAIQDFLSNSTVIKAFNHMGYHDLHDHAKPPHTPERKAIAIAGDSPQAVDQVVTLVNNFGFDPLVIGPLAQGKLLEAGQPSFGANLNLAQLKKLLNLPK